MTRAHAEAGYSLVELLVVLALLGLMAIAMSGGIRFGTRVWERTESEVAGTERASGGHALLRNLIANMYPRATTVDGAADGVVFSGSTDRMEFLTTGSGGVARIAISAKRESESSALVLVQSPERDADAERYETLTSGAKAIAFSYAAFVDGALTWSDSWDGQQAPPALVRIRISFLPGKGKWPDLIVRPRIDKDATCVYDPVSFGCRRG